METHRRQRRLTYLVSLFLTLGLPMTGVAAPLLYYSIDDVQLGNVTTKVAVPRPFEGIASSPAERIQAVLGQLRALRPQIYGNVTADTGDNFDISGVVVVKAESVSEDNRSTVTAELFHSFALYGMRELRIPSFSSAPLSTSEIAFPALQAVVFGWDALPPRQYVGVLVDIGNGQAITAAEFYDRLKKRDRSLSDSIIRVLQSNNSAAKTRLIGSIRELEVTDPIALLLPLTEDNSSEVKLAAITALDTSRSDPRVGTAMEKVVETDPNAAVKSAAVKVLIAAGNRKYEVFAVIDKLKDPNDAVVLDAVQKLVSSNNSAVAPALVDVLGHGSIDVRDAALKGLVALKNAAALELALGSNAASPEMKISVAKAMTGVEDRKAIVLGLSHLVTNGNPADAAAAAEAIGKLKATDGQAALISGLTNSNGGVRQACATALAEIGAIDAIEPLSAMAGNRQPGDEESATGAAVRILRVQPLSTVIERSKSNNATVRRFSLMALSGFAEGGRNRTVVGVLQERLSDTEPTIRQAAAYALARIEDESVANLLLSLKTDSDPKVREQVAVSLGWSKSPAAGDVLAEMLGDSSSDVKLAAAKSITQQKAHKPLDALLQYVSYGKPEVRRAVLEAIATVAQPTDNERLLDIYLTALYDQDSGVKVHAIDGISKIPDPRTVTGLSGLVIDPDDTVQKKVLLKLGAMKDPAATEAIARALFDDSKEVKMTALEALALSGQENAMKPLQEFIKNETDTELRAKANAVYDQL